MANEDADRSIHRRLFLGASAASLIGATMAQAQTAPTAPEMPPGGKTLAQILADFIVSFDLRQAPPAVIERARISFIDTLGVMLAGSQEHVSEIVRNLVQAEASAPAVTVVGQSLRASPQLAALANGVAAHAMDYDFTFMSGQAVIAVIPAILPVAESVGATPAELMAAFIVGVEVAARIVRANFDASLKAGWHTTGMVGVIGAAAGCCRLLKVPAAAIPDVLGITVSLASGRSANFGTMTKPMHAGNAARNGVMAAVLGKNGFTANPAAFEHHSGYFSGFGRGLDVTYEPFKDLGRRWDLVEGRYRLKPYPCGGLTHTAIEAALELRSRIGDRVADIGAIHCFVTRNAGQRAGTQYPANVESAKFSVAYLVPYALVHGAPRIPAFTEEALKDERIKALAKVVTASIDPDLGPGTDDSPAKLKISMKDGQVFELRRDYSTGSPQVPMPQAQLEEKFTDCAVHAVTVDSAKMILAALKAMPEGRPLNELWPLLRKA